MYISDDCIPAINWPPSDDELNLFFRRVLEGHGHRLRGRKPVVVECVGCGIIILCPDARHRRCGPCRKAMQAHDRRNDVRDTRRAQHDIQFVGIDGEGINSIDETGQQVHDYVLFSATGCEPLHKDGSRLTTAELFDWLYNTVRATHPEACFVGYSLGYDIAQWVKDLPLSRAESLYTKDGISKRRRKAEHMPPFPVYWNRFDSGHPGWEWEIDTLGDKRIKIRPYYGPRREHGKGLKWSGAQTNKLPWMYICDAFSFFQTSFLNAIDPKGRAKAGLAPYLTTKEDYELIVAGKANRDKAQFDPDMLRYNQAEVEVLAELMREVNEGLVQNHVRLKRTQFFGPGQVAQAFLDHTLAIPKLVSMNSAEDQESRDKLLQRLPRYIVDVCHDHAYCGREYVPVTGANVRERVPQSFRDAAKNSYYGGRFEVFYHGTFLGTSYEYDINSAYPKVMAQLPCLCHGQYLQGKGNPYRSAKLRSLKPVYGVGADKVLCLVLASVFGSHERMGALPHRTHQGGIIFPLMTKGWYWLHEIEVGLRAGLVDKVICEEWQAYIPCDCPPPLAWIETLYLDRAGMGEGKNSPAGVGKKLGYNSIYGKFAQSIGNPKYGNAIYASLITAGCRCMILDAIATHPRGAYAVLNIATDGVYFAEPHPCLDIDKTRLGAWDATPRSNLTLFKPGAYWDDDVRERFRRYLTTNDASNLFGLKMKARGVNVRALGVLIPEIDGQFARMQPGDPWPRLDVQIPFSVISPRVALLRKKWHLCGAVSTNRSQDYNSNPSLKRIATGPGFSRPMASNPFITELNQRHGSHLDALQTTYYKQTFGEPTRDEWIFRDGTLANQVEGLLFGKPEDFYERNI